MASTIEEKIVNSTIIKKLVALLKQIKLPTLGNFSVYDLLTVYLKGLSQGAITYRAAAIAFSFFMALFPFALFILNLIPYIPIKGFQKDFLGFVHQSVPPTTYDAISSIINDILNNSHSGLLSTGFLMAIFLI